MWQHMKSLPPISKLNPEAREDHIRKDFQALEYNHHALNVWAPVLPHIKHLLGGPQVGKRL